MTNEIEPIYRPGVPMVRGDTFICNINDEVSLWRCGGYLRAYAENSKGWWINQYRVRMITYSDVVDPSFRDRLVRNAEAVLTFAAMLDGSNPDGT